MGVIDRYSGPSPILGGPPNTRMPWVRFALSNAPAVTDSWGVKSVAYGASTGVFTVTLKHAFPKGAHLIGAIAELSAGNQGTVKLTSWDSNNQVATIEFYTSASASAPALSDGTTSIFLNLLFLCVER